MESIQIIKGGKMSKCKKIHLNAFVWGVFLYPIILIIFIAVALYEMIIRAVLLFYLIIIEKDEIAINASVDEYRKAIKKARK